MPRESTFHCTCWRVSLRPDEVERILLGLRKESPSMIIQVFSATRVPNARTVEMIAAQTLTAAKTGATLAERPELDLLLRLAGTRQIGEAFQRVGYKSGGRLLFMVAASEGDGAGLRRLTKMLVGDARFTEVEKKEEKNPSKGDLEMVERAALLAVRL